MLTMARAADAAFRPPVFATPRAGSTPRFTETPPKPARSLEECLEFLGLPQDMAREGIDELLIRRHVRIKERCDNCKMTGAEALSCARYYLKTVDGRLCEFARNCEKGEAYEAQRRIERLAAETNIDPVIRGRTFDNFRRTVATAQAYDVCRDFCQKFSPHRRGVYLSGRVGCGKTHLAGAVCNELKESGRGGLFVVVPELLELKRKSFDDASLRPKVNELFDRARTAPLLVLDDLGAESPTDFTRENIFTLIDARYRAGLPLIVTSNLSIGDKLKTQIGERSVSRLAETTTAVWIDAPDYRMEKAKARGAI